MELFMRFPGFKTKALTLSYDDGVIYDKTLIEILNRHRIKCTFNLNSGIKNDPRRIPEDEIKQVYAGHEIAVHTLTHPHLENLTKAEMAQEIIEDRKNLEAITGGIVDGMAYPFGLADTVGEPELAAECGICYSRTVAATHSFALPKDFLRWNPTCHHNDSMLSELTERFLAPDDRAHPWRIRPSVFYLWGHSYEFNDSDNWDIIESFCKKAGGNDAVWYATNGEIAHYSNAFLRIEKSADGKTVYNPTAIRLYFVAAGSEITLEPGGYAKL